MANAGKETRDDPNVVNVEKMETKPAETVTQDDVELSDEDAQLQSDLNTLVERLQHTDTTQYYPALEGLSKLIRASTTSMTSVPKPLKFLTPHYAAIKALYDRMPDVQSRQLCANIISVLSTATNAEEDCLRYRMLCEQPSSDIGEWGNEYVRHLTEQLRALYLDASKEQRAQYDELVKKVVPYHLAQHADSDACDLLIEIEQLNRLLDYVSEPSCARVCAYLQASYSFAAEQENSTILHAALALWRKFNKHTQAMHVALMLNDADKIREIFEEAAGKPAIRKQLAYMLGRQQILLQLDEEIFDFDDVVEIMSNTNLNKQFLSVAREFDIMEPKTPDDIYKTHLEKSRTRNAAKVDSAKQNMAASFVNGFVNAGFGTDTLLTADNNASKWLNKNKDVGIISTVASTGLIQLWDVEGGLASIDKYLYSKDNLVKAGGLLASGIVNCGVRNEIDPAHSLLSEFIENTDQNLRVGAILGLGIAYAGTNRAAVIETLEVIFKNEKSSNMDIYGITALALGMISVGSSNAHVSQILLELVMTLSANDLKTTYIRFVWLALGLLYLGRQTEIGAILIALEILEEPHRTTATTMINICAYAGTGNVLKVQELFRFCADHYESAPKTEAKDANPTTDHSTAQAFATIGIAMIAMGEPVGAEMVLRPLAALMRYSEPCIRRAVPLALGLLFASNPQFNLLDTLSKYSHDNDSAVAFNAVFAMGLVGAGTNNARLGSTLRLLAEYYAKDANLLYMVRIAQGLTHLGKGTLSLNPYHQNRQLLNPAALAALLATLVSLSAREIILLRPYMLYTIVPAIQPRMLMTLDEDLNQLQVQVRVGLAVDVVGQAGKPKTITGFQTHTTPVLIAAGERAELATDEYIPLAPIMEGFVILQKNPEYKTQ